MKRHLFLYPFFERQVAEHKQKVAGKTRTRAVQHKCLPHLAWPQRHYYLKKMYLIRKMIPKFERELVETNPLMYNINDLG